MAQKRASVREILSLGEIPPCENPERREACKKSLRLFLTTYKSSAFYLDLSPGHEEAIRRTEEAIFRGGLFALAMPRGSGKTTIAKYAAEWAILYGHCRFVVVVAGTQTKAEEIVDAVMQSFGSMAPPELRADFPLLARCVQHIDGIAQRAAGQMYQGVRTHIQWKRGMLVFPTLADSPYPYGGSVIFPAGLDGAIRGAHYNTPTGETIRPDFVILDDPQTEDSARSPSQCTVREERIKGAVLGLAGPDVDLAAVMPCTIIQKGDLADRFLSHEDHPEWRGIVTKMVNKWPDAQDTLWAEYGELRQLGLLEGDGGARANEFYREHREEMDKGAEVSWPQQFTKNEISALQHAQNLRLRLKDPAFMAEYQNSPQEAHPSLYDLRPENVQASINGLPRFVADDRTLITCGFIDVNPAYGLHYTLMWFTPDMTGGVLDYGKWPAHENEPLVSKDQKADEKLLIFKGLDDLCGQINAKQITCAGKPVSLDLLLIDCGYQMTTVFKYVGARQRRFNNIKYLACSRGWGSKKYRQTKAIVAGDNLHLTEFVGKGKVIVHNGDYWRVHLQKAFLIPVGAPGAIGLYGDRPDAHEKIGRHIASEQLVEFIKGDLADYYNWHIKVGEHNDLLDCVVGCCVGASFRGCHANIGNVGPQQAAKRGPTVRHHEL